MKLARRIAEFLVVGLCTLAFLFTAAGISASLLGSGAAGTKDFVVYWATGRQLVHKANPYDANAVMGLEQSAGFPLSDPVLIVRNPPSALLFVVPVGFLGPKVGLLLWSLLLLACLVTSVRMIWTMHARPTNQLDFLGYSFGPALVCLLVGQVSLLVLLGLVLFLRLHRSSPFLAGISVWLCLLKPHLFLPFGVALLAWAILTRSYFLLVGTAVALGVSSGIALLLDPAVWMHYGQMIGSPWIDSLAIPCLSVMLRRNISPNIIWLQYLPAVLGCIWALAYFRRHREHWDWMEHGSPLLIVSVLVSPYSWPTDQAILMPALLHALYQSRSRSLVAIFALSSALFGVWSLRGDVPLHSAFYLWFPPAWLAWYLYATKRSYATKVYEVPLLADGAP